MSALDIRENIHKALGGFASPDLIDASLALFSALGYESKKRIRLKPNSLAGFRTQFPKATEINEERALVSQWKSIDFLFQLSDEEVTKALDFGQEDIFANAGQVDDKRIESYLFFAIDLKPREASSSYTRTELSGITRAINKLFPMPVMLLFRHGDTISLAVINRRLHKRDTSKDVMEKVTLVKDISYANPLRAHIEILNDLSITPLYDEFRFTNFVGLHHAWEKRLATYSLNERFYREIADWYFEALSRPDVAFPRSIEESEDKVVQEKQKSLFFIRLLTRLIFCWFLQEKRLIPRDLFRERVIKKMLKDPSAEGSSYYTAFLQNLFFATLNHEQGKRDWRKKYDRSRDGNVGVTNLWRYADALKDPAALETLLRDNVPFVNGGLFDCLDDQAAEPKVFLDGFSERKDNTLRLPNSLFFAQEHVVDLSDVYQDKRRSKEKVSGLINILSRYKFTVEENTPLEEEIALDPELLGKVFENLLASFNEDTQTTARKSLGAFYTPRSVVSYMVDEALISHLAAKVPSVTPEKLRALMKDHTDDGDPHISFSGPEIKSLVQIIGSVRILDHAAGSGAFLMGALHRLVDLLQKLDPNNESWKRDRLNEARAYYDSLRMQHAPDDELSQVEHRINDIEKSFDTRFHELDYARKLYLIENCIYGVDIQPVACQIAKLRFFIALIVDQKTRPDAPNMGVTPMPNLETKVVAANSLLPLDVPEGDIFSGGELNELRQELLRIRHEHFDARTPARKKRLRERDAALRQRMATYLVDNGLPSESATALANWNPYDQNSAASFFDPSWMFGFAHDNALFDVVLANPPYVRQEKIKDLKSLLKPHYPNTFAGTADIYVYFYDRAIQLLRKEGVLSFITSNKWYRSGYGQNLRKYLARTVSLVNVIDFGDAAVFTAIAYPTIVVARSSPPPAAHQFRSLNWDPKTPKQEIDHFAHFYDQHATIMTQSSLEADGWRFIDGASQQLLVRIKAAGAPLGQYVNGRLYRGVLTGLNEAFVVDRETRDRLIKEDPKSEELLKPFLRGRDVKRWRVDFQDLWLIFTRRGTKINNYKAIKKHLSQYREALEPKPSNWDDGKAWPGRKAGSYEWFEIQDNIAYYEEFEQPKIVFPDIAPTCAFAWDSGEHYLVNTSYIMICDSWVLSVLNSQVVLHFYLAVSSAIRGGYLRFIRQYVEQIPIPNTSKIQQETLGKLVNYLSLTGESESSRDSLMLGYFEQILNALVYELYFPEDLNAKGLRFFNLVEEAELPAIGSIPKGTRLGTIRHHFEQIYDLKHPIRAALQTLQSLDVVRTIEGER